MRRNRPTEVLFCAGTLRIAKIGQIDLDSSLQVYRQCEDFLSLGPVARASMEMLLKDMNHSENSNGFFCGIWDEIGNQVGVIDFIPEKGKGTAILELLMVAKPFRKMGFGSEVLRCLESYLKTVYKTRRMESGVQVNNEDAIRFWRRHGFHIEERGRDMGDGTTAYEMYKDIS
jgi:RimJ/RimL family protein N-acetyltransferase